MNLKAITFSQVFFVETGNANSSGISLEDLFIDETEPGAFENCDFAHDRLIKAGLSEEQFQLFMRRANRHKESGRRIKKSMNET